MWALEWLRYVTPTPLKLESFTRLSYIATSPRDTSLWMVVNPLLAPHRYFSTTPFAAPAKHEHFHDHIFCVAQGKFQGLDLNEELHVGGHPNYTVLAKTAGIKSGFVGKTSQRWVETAILKQCFPLYDTWDRLFAGCIRQLIIQGEEVIFKDLDRSSTGVTNCPTCKDQPCQVRPINPHFVFSSLVGWLVAWLVSWFAPLSHPI